jgi:hypothetical protein
LGILETKKDFEICLNDVAKGMQKIGFKVQKAHLERHLLDKKLGVDYIKMSGYSKTSPCILTLVTRDCFKSICIRTPQGGLKHIIEKYFFIAEERYRENSLYQITDRRQKEHPHITTRKMQFPVLQKRYPVGDCTYTIDILDETGKHLGWKEGKTKNVNRRSPEIAHLYEPFLTRLVKQHLTQNDPIAVEQCVLAATPNEERSPLIVKSLLHH